jgi:hypothetical protein
MPSKPSKGEFYMNKFYLTGALFASALAMAGCNKGATTNNTAAPAATNTAAPATPAAPAGGNTAGGEEGAAPAGGQQNFTLVNNTGHTVVTLNVSASNQNSWGDDILGRDTLANGESASITFPHSETECNFDIKATYDDNTTTDARGVNLCTLSTVTLTP